MIKRSLFISLLLVASVSLLQAATLQKRDHLTEKEVDLVKEAQVLDKRIDVFIKAAERRLMVINNSAAANASPRWLDATPTKTIRSPGVRRLTRCTMRTPSSGQRVRASATWAAISRSANPG